MNPSFAGSNGASRIQTSIETGDRQAFFGQLKTHSSIDQYINRLNGGVGLSVATQKFGSFLSQQDLNFNWAQHIQLTEKTVKLIPSLIIGYSRSKIDPDFFISNPGTFTQMISERLLVGSSVLLEIRKRLYFGVVVRDFDLFNLSSSNFTESLELLTGGCNLSYNLQIGKNNLLQTLVRLSTTNRSTSCELGLTYLHKHLLLGFGQRIGDIVYCQIGYKNKHWLATVQSDITISRLSGRTSSAFVFCIATSFGTTGASGVWKSVETW